MGIPGPPLRPSGGEGRRLLADELVHSEYHRHDLVRRLLGWLWSLLQGGVGAASGTGWLPAFATLLVLALLAIGLAVLVTRVRRDRRQRVPTEAVLARTGLGAAELRRRAEAALAQGRSDDALLDAFRALAVRQVERGRLANEPGTTAHEVAASLAATFPEHGSRVGRSADLFDATLYGDRTVGPEDARGVLALDDALAGSR